jgi:hypothetical protein
MFPFKNSASMLLAILMVISKTACNYKILNMLDLDIYMVITINKTVTHNPGPIKEWNM